MVSDKCMLLTKQLKIILLLLARMNSLIMKNDCLNTGLNETLNQVTEKKKPGASPGAAVAVRIV